jgi:hypothetical protein
MIASLPPPYRASTALADDSVRVVMEAIDTLPIGDRLLALRSIAGLVGSRRAGTVVAARTAGMSWAEIADRLGTSRQAVWKRFGPEEADPPSPRTYSSCASYKAVTTRPPLEIAS